MSSDTAWISVGVGVVAGLLGLAAIENLNQISKQKMIEATADEQDQSKPMTYEEQLARKVLDLMDREHYAEAVSHACKALFGLIRKKSGIVDKDTMTLVDHAFRPSKPVLKLERHKDHKHLSTHEGYYFLLKGVSAAFRNPAAHEDIKMDRREASLQIALIAHLYEVIEQHCIVCPQEC